MSKSVCHLIDIFTHTVKLVYFPPKQLLQFAPLWTLPGKIKPSLKVCSSLFFCISTCRKSKTQKYASWQFPTKGKLLCCHVYCEKRSIPLGLHRYLWMCFSMEASDCIFCVIAYAITLNLFSSNNIYYPDGRTQNLISLSFTLKLRTVNLLVYHWYNQTFKYPDSLGPAKIVCISKTEQQKRH